MTQVLPKREIGKTGLLVPVYGYGAASLGNLYREVDDTTACKTLEAAFTAGLTYIDTAPHYGFGLSERRVGDFLRGQPKTDYVVSTKVGRRLKPIPGHVGASERLGFLTPMPFEISHDYSYDGIMRSYEDSLQRLGLAEIDILYVHDIGVVTHGEHNARHLNDLKAGGFKALEELRGSGSVKAIGLGVNECEACAEALDYGDVDVFLLAGRYTLLEQGALDALLPRCAERNVSLVIGGAYNSGILATGVKEGVTAYYNYEPAPSHVIDRVRKLEQVCASHNVDLKAAALQFPLAHPNVCSVIPGIGNPKRVAQTVDLINQAVPDELWRDLKSEALIRSDAPISGLPEVTA